MNDLVDEPAKLEQLVAEEEKKILELLFDQRVDDTSANKVCKSPPQQLNEARSAQLDKLVSAENEGITTSSNSAVDTDVQNIDSDHTIATTELPIAYIPPVFDSVPSLIYDEKFSTFTKGVKFAPDGQTFAVCTDDNRIHLRRTAGLLDGTNMPGKIVVGIVASVREAQPIHDFAWHPSHEFCAFVTTCNTQPIHLYCGQTVKLLSSYVARNHLDEHISAYCLKFSRTGEQILAGFKKFVRIFDVECPGVWYEIATWKQYQAGIVSALDTNGEKLLAVGTYCNTVALYDLRDKTMAYRPEEGHKGGVTQIRFSYDGNLCYSGARKDNFILCRDLRNFSKVIHEFPRQCTTNQRIHFDLPYEENYLATGNTDGTAFIWNRNELQTFGENGTKCRPNLIFTPHANVRLTKSSATNGLSFHPWAPVIATSSGGRGTSVWDDKSEQVIWESPYENRVKLWKFVQ